MAEDDEGLRQIVAELIRLDGHEVTTVSDGKEMLKAIALASVTQFPKDGFDLIVTDVRMPGVTGLNAIARLRAVGYLTPVITITAFPDSEVLQQARELDMMVIDKPFRLRDLRDAAQYFIGRPDAEP